MAATTPYSWYTFVLKRTAFPAGLETSIGKEFFYEYLNQRVVFYEQDHKQIFRHFATPPLPSQNTSRIKLGIRSGRNVQKYT